MFKWIYLWCLIAYIHVFYVSHVVSVIYQLFNGGVECRICDDCLRGVWRGMLADYRKAGQVHRIHPLVHSKYDSKSDNFVLGWDITILTWRSWVQLDYYQSYSKIIVKHLHTCLQVISNFDTWWKERLYVTWDTVIT